MASGAGVVGTRSGPAADALVQVAGGGHFAGWMLSSAWDMARLGDPFLRNGGWGGRQIDSEK
jgi:CubicO group peptidase (beta-lactamase class C family)